MNAEATIANRLRSLSIERNEIPPAAPLAAHRLPRRRAMLAVVAVGCALAAYTSPMIINGLSKDTDEHVASVPQAAPATASMPRDPAPAPTANRTVIGSGYVIAERMITLRPEIGGKVSELPLDVGDRFIAGQLIAGLDTTTEEIELRIARSQAAGADASVRRSEASLAQARKTLERTRQLSERGAASVSSLDSDSLAVLQMTSDLDVARQSAETARLQVARQERNMALHRIVAPFDGIVVNRLVGLGDMVASGTDGGGPRDGIAILLDPASLVIDVDVAQSNAARIKPGQTARAVLDAFPHRPLRMRVRTIVPAASLQKGTVTARLEFTALPTGLLPNMAAKVTLNTADLETSTNEKGATDGQ